MEFFNLLKKKLDYFELNLKNKWKTKILIYNLII